MEQEWQVDGFSQEQAEQLSSVMRRFIASYSNKADTVSDNEWLKQELMKELPEISAEEAERLSGDSIREIARFDRDLRGIDEAVSRGETKESWFAAKLQEASSASSIHQFGGYLQSVETSIRQSNTQMLRVITNLDGSVNRSLNLDGFIAEQYHVNSFNMQSKLAGSALHAEVRSPEPGQTYGKNSFDVVIKDGNNRIVHQYQMKYGADAKETIRLIKQGNYNNQRIIVPAEQLEEVRKAFPGKSIDSMIGGTDKVGVSSRPLGKKTSKALQEYAQAEGVPVQEDWNHFKTKALSLQIGKQAGLAGVQAAVLTTGFDLARRVATGEEWKTEETVQLAVRSGADAGVKAAATGAVHAGVQRGIITVIPKGTPVDVIANVVCVGIENAKILGKVGSGELSMTQGLDRMGRTTTSMVYGLSTIKAGAAIGAAALSWIPVIGPVVGGFVGGSIGYMAGSKFGDAVYSACKKTASVARSAVSKTWEGVKSAGKMIMRTLFG